MAHLPMSLSLSSLYHLQSGTNALSPAILLMLFPLSKNLPHIYIRESYTYFRSLLHLIEVFETNLPSFLAIGP